MRRGSENAENQANEEDNGFANLDPIELVHTGDTVLLKCTLGDDASAEASNGVSGFLTGDGVLSIPKLTQVTNFNSVCDIRDHLWVVVDQLGYKAVKDLRKQKKLLQNSDDSGVAGAPELRNLEERAAQEERQNLQTMVSGRRKPLCYGDILQLQHIRTGQFIGIKPKISASQQQTSRRVELQDGSGSCWLYVNPFFSHRSHGEPVLFNEHVSFESVKLSDQWNLNYFKYTNFFHETEYEVNCAKGGRSFFFVLYSRATSIDIRFSNMYALSYGLPMRLYVPHRGGSVAVSSRKEKTEPYLRMCVIDEIHTGFGAKDVWVIEPLNHDFLKDAAIEFGKTQVVLRHLGSGCYLSVSEDDLMDQGEYLDRDMIEHRESQSSVQSGLRLSVTPTSSLKRPMLSMETLQAIQDEPVSARMVGTLTIACVFTLETTNIQSNTTDRMYVHKQQPCVMIKWDHSSTPLWLSCLGRHKGVRDSMLVQWSRIRSSRDAIRLDILNEHPHMRDYDVVVMHRNELRQIIIPRFSGKLMSSAEIIIALQYADQALSDMILFLSKSSLWRQKPDAKIGLGKPDPLKQPWSADPVRQRLVRELKYIDETFNLFHALARMMPELSAEQVDFGMRLKGRSSGILHEVDARGLEGSATEKSNADELKTHVMKVLVRLWLYCFLRNPESERYFHRRGWMDTLDSLNGRGLGASDVFVTLLSENRELVRKVGSPTVTRFVNFIRTLGPLDTWLLFLKALCNPEEGGAVSDKQQLVLTHIAFQGLLAPEKERASVRRNREELLVTLALQGPIGEPLTRRPMDRQIVLEECLAPSILAHGVHDVAVCWTHPAEWEIGKGVLFHGPERLGLPVLQTTGGGRKWISLVQVAWVLQPERCCQAVTGKTWKEVHRAELEELKHKKTAGMERANSMIGASDWSHNSTLGKVHHARDSGNPFDVTRIELLRMLAKYFQAQLQLIGALTKDRQMNSIMALQNEYSFSVCLSGAADPRLPCSVRAVFFDLLTYIWVDRFPHMEIVVPRLMRSLAGDGVLALPTFKLWRDGRFDAWSPEHARSLPKEVRDFYQLRTPDKLEGLVQALSQYLLAGTSIEQQVHSQTDDCQLMIAVVRNYGSMLRFGFIQSFKLIQEIQGALLRILDGRTDWLEPAAARPRRASKQPAQPSMTPELSPLLQVNEPAHSSTDRGPPIDDSAQRYRKVDKNKLLVQSKVAIAEVLLQTCSLGLDIWISQVLTKFKEFAEGRMPITSMVEEVIRVMDNPVLPMVRPGVLSPHVMLVDLIMYEDEKLMPLALELLADGLCSVSSAFIDKLAKVKLLDAQQQELMYELAMDVRQIGRIIYGFENWAYEDAFSTRDLGTLEELKQIGQKLENLCSGKGQLATGPMVQNMLRETEFLSLANYWLQLDLMDTDPENRLLQNQVTGILCAVSAAFCRGNVKNQAAFLQFLPSLAKTVEEEESSSAVLIAEIFCGNLESCQQVPRSLIEKFGEIMTRSRRAGKYFPWYINFFTAIVTVGPQPVSENQVLVIECLQKNRPKALISADMPVDRVVSLIKNFQSYAVLRGPLPSNWNEGDKELIYYSSSLDLLIGIAKGRGNNLVNKPFVLEHFPVMHGLSILANVKAAATDSVTQKTVIQHLRTRWLHLLQLLLYDLETTQLDFALLCSSSHLTFLGNLLTCVEELLALGPVQPTPRESASSACPGCGNVYLPDAIFCRECGRKRVQPQGAGAVEERPSFQELGTEKEEYLSALLTCIESFFNGPFKACSIRDDAAGDKLTFIGQRFLKRFRILERSQQLKSRLPRSCSELMDVASFRVIGAMDGQSSGAKPLSMRGLSIEEEAPTAFERHVSGDSAAQAKWQEMLNALHKDERVQQRLEWPDQMLGQTFLNIYPESDPDNGDYLKVEALQPPVIDFRRNHITLLGAVNRLIRHCETHITDVQSLRRVLRILGAIISVARATNDHSRLTTVQAELCDAGVSKLLVQILDKHNIEDIRLHTWRLLSELLSGMQSGGLSKVNKVVQKSMQEALYYGYDDVGLWESFNHIINVVSRSVKPVHAFRLLPSLTSQEHMRLREYRLFLEQAISAMEATRLMAEGHFKEMQDYLYQQEGNTRSWNVPGLACSLLSRLCKTSTDANIATDLELDCIRAIVALLTELAQGPNLRIQEFLSNLGLIELVFKLLAVPFEQLQKAGEDVYPSSVRQLKADMMLMLLALLESRLDSKIHKTMLQRADRQVVRERIEFVYLYYIFGSVAVSSGAVQSSDVASVPLDGNIHRLMLPSADVGQLFHAVEHDSHNAEELLEDLNDEQLTLMFAEGFFHVQLVLELSAHSSQFKDEVMPVGEEHETFRDNKELFSTQRDYLRALAAYRKRSLYRQSFNFLRRFVKTIEVVLHGHLQTCHFQMPVTAMWYVQGASKQRILDEVPFNSPDIKMKSFVTMCLEIHAECQLILGLSRFSLLPQRYRRWAQRNLPDAVHRPFFVFLANDAKYMQWLLRASLWLSLCLAIHTGLYLAPVTHDDFALRWTSPMTEQVSQVLGSLHFTATIVWLSVYSCIKVPLSIKATQQANPSRNQIANIVAAWVKYLSQPALLWRFMLMIVCATALFCKHWWIYSFLVTDFFCQSSSLQTVLSGIVAPAQPLFMTFLGAAIITFVYAAIGLHYFRNDFGDYCDTNILVCCESILYMGTRAGIIGLSGMMQTVMPDDDTWYERMTYDISYFVIFGIMLLNTIVALIVDSFQTQRREASTREHNLETQSFVSCIDRKTIETVAQQIGISDGFAYHETNCQHKWDYMAFIFQLSEKDLQNFTGPEQAIWQCIERNDIQWLPIGRSKLLEGRAEDSKEDSLQLIERQNAEIITALQVQKDGRENLFKSLSSLARMMRDKTELVVESISQFVNTPPGTPRSDDPRRRMTFAKSSSQLELDRPPIGPG